MIARREYGLDHLSDLDTLNLREFNSVFEAIFESLEIGRYLAINLNDSRLGRLDTITRKK